MLHPRLRALFFSGSILVVGFASAELLFPAWVLSSLGADLLAPALVLSACGYSVGFLFWQLFGAHNSARWTGILSVGLLSQGLVLAGALFQFCQSNLWLWFTGIALFNCSIPPTLAAQQSLWHRWITAHNQPSFFAARYTFDWTIRLLTVALCGLLLDSVLAPLLIHLDSPLIGAGLGRPMAVALGIVGIAQLLTLFSFSPSLLSSVDKAT